MTREQVRLTRSGNRRIALHVKAAQSKQTLEQPFELGPALLCIRVVFEFTKQRCDTFSYGIVDNSWRRGRGEPSFPPS